MSGKLQRTADQVLKACMRAKNPWRPTTRDIQRRFGLNERQVVQVKRYTTKYASELGIQWGWHDEMGYFRVASSDFISKQMRLYSLRHWKHAGATAAYQARAAYANGRISKNELDEVLELAGEFDLRIDHVRKPQSRRRRTSLSKAA